MKGEAVKYCTIFIGSIEGNPACRWLLKSLWYDDQTQTEALSSNATPLPCLNFKLGALLRPLDYKIYYFSKELSNFFQLQQQSCDPGDGHQKHVYVVWWSNSDWGSSNATSYLLLYYTRMNISPIHIVYRDWPYQVRTHFVIYSFRSALAKCKTASHIYFQCIEHACIGIFSLSPVGTNHAHACQSEHLA